MHGHRVARMAPGAAPPATQSQAPCLSGCIDARRYAFRTIIPIRPANWTRIHFRLCMGQVRAAARAVEAEVVGGAQDGEEGSWDEGGDDDADMDPEKAQPDPEAFPLPQAYQQTLRRSLTLGGIGLHTGEYAYVRVRPALAGEGRYFVRVPPGTNAGRFVVEEPESRTLEDLDIDAPEDDPYEDERSEVFFKWLAARGAGYEGNLDDFSEEHGKDFEALFNKEDALDDPTLPDEEVQARGALEAWVPACIASASAASAHHTKLQREDVSILSPEALLSTLEACGIDNARIEIEGGSEVPVIDGSAMGWAVELRSVGVRPCGPQSTRAVWLSPPQPLTVGDGDAFITFYPGDVMKLTAGVEFEAPAIGRQWHTWSPDQDEHFRYEVAPARRCFDSPEEVEALTQEGLLRGGADFVALVAQGQDWYDDSLLRFPVDDSEAARHAIQSLLGVLALAALPGSRALPLGHTVMYRAGLPLQLEFARALRRELTRLAAETGAEVGGW
ncbi:hypothetical protein ACKKBF_B33170 [Auxenochlorella protothecoides x Auxenochlorella symbiontica]